MTIKEVGAGEGSAVGPGRGGNNPTLPSQWSYANLRGKHVIGCRPSQKGRGGNGKNHYGGTREGIRGNDERGGGRAVRISLTDPVQ